MNVKNVHMGAEVTPQPQYFILCCFFVVMERHFFFFYMQSDTSEI